MMTTTTTMMMMMMTTMMMTTMMMVVVLVTTTTTMMIMMMYLPILEIVECKLSKMWTQAVAFLACWRISRVSFFPAHDRSATGVFPELTSWIVPEKVITTLETSAGVVRTISTREIEAVMNNRIWRTHLVLEVPPEGSCLRRQWCN